LAGSARPGYRFRTMHRSRRAASKALSMTPAARRAALQSRRRIGSRVWAHIACALLVALGVALRVAHYQVEVYTPDEDAYVNFYGVPLLHDGPAGVPALVRNYNSRPPLQQFPPPTRIGHLLPMVAIMRFCGDHELPTAALFSAFSSVALLLLLWRFGAMFDPWVAAIALLFAAVSPLDLAMSRRAWGDEALALCSAAMMFACASFAARPERLRWAVIALALGVYAALIKESGFLLLAFAGFVLTVVSVRARDVRSGIVMAVGAIAAVLLAVGILAGVCGGLTPVRTAFAAMQLASRTNEYVRAYQTGGIGYYAVGLALLQPLPMLLGFVAALGVALRLPHVRAMFARLGGGAALTMLAWLVIAISVVAVFYAQKNLRFLSPIYPALDLLAGALVVASFHALTAKRDHRIRVIVFSLFACALVAAAALDHARFVDDFIARGIPDLATPWFTRIAR
jgi:Dolichyl-phosphate-mannose-protein mannosyltransferase